MKVDTAIILAGGLGTRLRSVVSDVPKPMAPIGGQPFLGYLIDYWYQQGIRHFVLSVGYMHQHIIDFFGTSYKKASISYAIEHEPLGTGGGLLQAMKKVSHVDEVLVLNGDTYFEVDLASLTAYAQEFHTDILFSAFLSSNHQRYMALPIENQFGKIDFNLKLEKNEQNFWVNGGVYLMRPEIFDFFDASKLLKLSLEQDVFQKLFDNHARIYGKLFDKKFIDIGIPEDYFKFQLWQEQEKQYN
jgi:D-glycero-alpha-D-manno-heptose 1-phosphate guanylyltransferase